MFVKAISCFVIFLSEGETTNRGWMHTVVLFGLSVSVSLSPFFLELSTTFKDILNFGFLGFFLDFWWFDTFFYFWWNQAGWSCKREARQRKEPRLDKPRSRPVCGSHVNHVNTLLRDCHNCHTNTRLYNSRCVCFFNQLTTLSARKGDLVPVTSRIKGDLEFVDFW